MAKISVIIPVYNVKAYLEKCVESVVNQDFSDYEIILIDDGSSDGSENLCDRLGEKYPEIAGVLVVAKGADDITVKMAILNAVTVALGVNCNKVQILAR